VTVAPTVSVLICFLDAERFLSEALASVYAQTFDDWELLLIDDGSRDGSTAIAGQAASAREDRVRVLTHPGRENRGISASRNLGIREARGRYLAFLDADDVWLPDKLERQVAVLDANPDIAMTYGPTERWYGWTGRPSDVRRNVMRGTGLAAGTAPEPPQLLRHYLESGGEFVPGICSLLVRRDAATAVGGFDDRFRGVFEDQVFLSKITSRYRVLVTDDCTARYRQHPASCCAVASEKGEYDPTLPNAARGRYLSWLKDYLAEAHVADAALLKALHRERRPYGHPLVRWPYTGLPELMRSAKRATKQAARALLPAPVTSWLEARIRGRAYVPPPGWVRFGNLRRVVPLGRAHGDDRCTPIDRYYVEKFLARHAHDIRGHTIEIGDDSYTRRFGGSAVSRADVLRADAAAVGAAIIGDLADAEHVPSNTFDCFVLPQTLQLVFDVKAAIATIHRVLVPGGVVLATLPGLGPLADDERGKARNWGFTPLSARRLFEALFDANDVDVASHGNVLAATAFLHGIAAEELKAEELDHDDPSFPVVITLRAVKSNCSPLNVAGKKVEAVT